VTNSQPAAACPHTDLSIDETLNIRMVCRYGRAMTGREMMIRMVVIPYRYEL
jgi:hypothetical protein